MTSLLWRHLEPHRPQLEICAETLQACSAAAEGGADRIEICSALSEGGLTPSHALIRSAIEAGHGLPVYVLLRPRPGNFVYTDEEFAVICEDLEHAREIGAAGFVAGVLTEQHTVDKARMRVIVSLAKGKEVTFHRAIDHAANISESLEQVIAVGCGRVLTSGGKPSVRQGVSTIAELAQQAAGRIRIAAGGGVSAGVATRLLHRADVDLHASLKRRTQPAGSSASQDPLWRGGQALADVLVSDVRELAAIVRSS